MKVTRTASEYLFENGAVIVPAGRRLSILDDPGKGIFGTGRISSARDQGGSPAVPMCLGAAQEI
ncbi:hypothetical protein ES705_11428 [subsurface metagenome]